jgi:hypothetical protein
MKLKNQIAHYDIDPYGEEDWSDEIENYYI